MNKKAKGSKNFRKGSRNRSEENTEKEYYHRKSGFSADTLRENTNPVGMGRELLLELRRTEDQAIAFAKVFRKRGYVSTKNLPRILSEMELDSASLGLVATFFFGYQTAEEYDSKFDVNIFGSHSMLDGKRELMRACLSAVIDLVDETGKIDLPDRRKKPKRLGSKS